MSTCRKAPRGTRRAARIADEGQPQAEFIGEPKQLVGVLVAEHRRLVADDVAAAGHGGVLHFPIDQEAGDGIRLETVVLQHLGRLGGGAEIGHVLPLSPHPLVELGQQATICLPRPDPRAG